MATNEVVADQLSDYRSSLARARAFLRAANGAIDTADRGTAIETLAPEVKLAKTVAGRRRVVSAMKARQVEYDRCADQLRVAIPMLRLGSSRWRAGP